MSATSTTPRHIRLLPHHWKLWSLPRPAQAFVIAVDLLALAAVIAATRSTPTGAQWITFGWLAACAVMHLHASHVVERVRRDHSHSPYVDLCSVWIFAGALVLSPPLELLLVALIYIHRWVMVNRFDAHRPPHRTVFTASTLALAASAAMLIARATELHDHLLTLDTGAHPGLLDAVVLVAAIGAQWTVNTVLIAGVILLTAHVHRARDVLGGGHDNLLEVAQLTLGLFVALALLWWPPTALLMIVPVVALHQCVLLHQLRLAARTDQRTGLLHAVAWQDQARVELQRVRAERGTMAVLMVDLDFFKRINDTHGHLVGDDVLIKVADALTKAARRGDSVGRYGGEEFAVLLPDVTEDEARVVAERIRHRVRGLQITDHSGRPVHVSATVGGAVYPDIRENTIEGLLRAADAALYAGKAAGRDRVALAARG
ncbi:MAG: diguanylate cyclase [Amycolatopsis sp.]|uniref:GGDEF domain-containing protein n=1 Tax=Amycolatopsis sp. TaxID=37632 RepID=UPI00261EC8BA|nr:GGDEF domain-containing protein [Amycolatopsis sp.]MCU1685210.1 diguanylate cyclase [Amycolatopsis sp.]